MKNLLMPIVIILFLFLAVLSCSKGGNNYSVTDHTVGISKVRTWSGYAYGNAHGDTLEGANHFGWPRAYSHTITDTSFSIIAIDGFTINVDGIRLPFRSVDSVHTMVVFDSIYAGAARSFLVWDFGKDTMHFEYHELKGWNDTAKMFYEAHKVLHSY